jgi:hypothetical protein
MYLPLTATRVLQESRHDAWRATLSRIGLGTSETGGLPGLRFERKDGRPVELGTRLETFSTDGYSQAVEARVTLWEPQSLRCEITVFASTGEKTRCYCYSVTAHGQGQSQRHLLMKIYFSFRPLALLRLLASLPFVWLVARNAA